MIGTPHPFPRSGLATLACGMVVLGCPAPLFAQAGQPLQLPQLPVDTPPPPEAAMVPAPGPTSQIAAPISSEPAADLVSAQVGTRVAVRAQNPNAPKDLDDVGSDGLVMAVFSGQVHPLLKWQAGFLGSYGTPAASSPMVTAELLDLVTQFEFAEAFNLWIGRMPVPSDRASLSTEWAIAPWTLPGNYGFYQHPTSAGPRRYLNDRGDGVTAWGQLHGGRFKYYLGAFGLGQPRGASPLYSARLSISLLDPEPGYRTTSGYYGSKQILSFGVGMQHRTNGSMTITAPPFLSSDFNEFHTDLLFEVGDSHAGVLDIEGSFAKMWGDYEALSYQSFALVSYLLPIEIGIGRFQPLLRVQHAGQSSAAGAGDLTSIDAQLGYIIDGARIRLLTLYQYSRLSGQTENALLFGVQLLTHAK